MNINVKPSIYERLIRLGQVTNPVTPTPSPNQPAFQDARNLPGAKQYLYSFKNWVFINSIVNALSNALYEIGKGQKVGGKDLSFKTVILNPSIITGFTGSAKSFVQLILFMWRYLSVDNTINNHNVVYTDDQVLKIIDLIIGQINAAQFTDPRSLNYKAQILNILNNWKAAN